MATKRKTRLDYSVRKAGELRHAAVDILSRCQSYGHDIGWGHTELLAQIAAKKVPGWVRSETLAYWSGLTDAVTGAFGSGSTTLQHYLDGVPVSGTEIPKGAYADNRVVCEKVWVKNGRSVYGRAHDSTSHPIPRAALLGITPANLDKVCRNVVDVVAIKRCLRTGREHLQDDCTCKGFFAS